MLTLPPASLSELLSRAKQLAGCTLEEIAIASNASIPQNLKREKGWVGQLLEKCLGATAGNLDQPDFPHLAVELKTLPVNRLGEPLESTYLCYTQIPPTETDFFQSRVWRKIKNILWIPIHSTPDLSISEREVGHPCLWTPCQNTVNILKNDWEELTEMLRLGYFEQLNAQKGFYLQLRPKAPNAQTLVKVIDHLGQAISIVPKGFYLRTDLTKQILQAYFA